MPTFNNQDLKQFHIIGYLSLRNLMACGLLRYLETVQRHRFQTLYTTLQDVTGLEVFVYFYYSSCIYN